MSMIKKTISITNEQEQWVKAQIESGEFGNESEVIRDALRARKQRKEEIESIRAALEAGRQSGVSDMTLEEIRDEIYKKHGINVDN